MRRSKTALLWFLFVVASATNEFLLPHCRAQGLRQTEGLLPGNNSDLDGWDLDDDDDDHWIPPEVRAAIASSNMKLLKCSELLKKATSDAEYPNIFGKELVARLLRQRQAARQLGTRGAVISWDVDAGCALFSAHLPPRHPRAIPKMDKWKEDRLRKTLLLNPVGIDLGDVPFVVETVWWSRWLKFSVWAGGKRARRI